MKINLVIVLAVLLSSCQSFNIGKPWPVIPDKEKTVYLTPCEPLELSKVGDGMPELIGSVEQNYLKWHLCNAKVQGWITWYNTHWKNREK
jgi:hypothetical protein